MRRRKTIVVEKVQRRTPTGRLLSETKTRTVHFDNIAMDEINFRPTTPIPSRPPVSLSPKKYVPSECESATEIVEFRRFGDRADYYDNWDTAVVREARLIRSDSMRSNLSLSTNLLNVLYDHINDIRIRNGVPKLIKDHFLVKEAKDQATQIALEGKLRPKKYVSSNIWIGKRDFEPHEIVREWNAEMKDWPKHNFECARLKKIGISQMQKLNNSHVVIVALYS
uniref:Uncharacterized protein n=1 Tax=Panagrolaimus sp. PS1159 TaxID=55785 RepID=A0AC35FB22_9BILA